MKIRNADEKDLSTLIDLTMRLKKLNEGFDPMLKVDKSAEKYAKEYLLKSIKECVVLVAEDQGKIAGFIRAMVRDRGFYSPRHEGIITEFYVMPEHRRNNLGEKLINECIKELHKKGAGIITAKFPSQNKFASSFYEKLGFRSIKNIYAKV